jgi:hypothetical protein
VTTYSSITTYTYYKHAKVINMDVKQTMMDVLQSSAAVEIMNEIVLHALQSSRDTCVEMRELLEAKRDRKGRWSGPEAEDWESLVQDIAALNRVIDYYGG